MIELGHPMSDFDSDPEEIFSQVQRKYKTALSDYWRIAAVENFESQNQLFIENQSLEDIP